MLAFVIRNLKNHVDMSTFNGILRVGRDIREIGFDESSWASPFVTGGPWTKSHWINNEASIHQPVRNQKACDSGSALFQLPSAAFAKQRLEPLHRYLNC